MNADRNSDSFIELQIPSSENAQSQSRSSFISPTVIDDLQWYNSSFPFYLNEICEATSAGLSIQSSLGHQNCTESRKLATYISQTIVRHMIEDAFNLSDLFDKENAQAGDIELAPSVDASWSEIGRPKRRAFQVLNW
eukprot:768429-Hanusia_phi.AAC.18